MWLPSGLADALGVSPWGWGLGQTILTTLGLWISSILLAMLYGTGEQGLSCQVTTSQSSPSSLLGKKPWGLGAGGWVVHPSVCSPGP